MRFHLWTAAALSTALAATSSTALERGDPDDVTIEGSADGIELIRLLEFASAVTGEVYFYDSSEAADARVPLHDKVVVPHEKFPSLLDECLTEAGFVILGSSVSGRVVHSICRIVPTRRARALKSEAPKVSLEELEKQPDRQTLVTSWMICRSSTLARQIACPILCQFFSDSAIAAIRSVEDSPVIVMTGRADNVLRFAAMGKRIDEEFGPARLSEDFANVETRIRALEESVSRLERERERVRARR